MELQKIAQMFSKVPDEIQIASRNPESPFFTKAIENILNGWIGKNALILPDLQAHNKSVAIFSDYSGDTKESLYNVYSFLFCSWDGLHTFKTRQDALRTKAGLNSPVKEIAFKSMGYGPQARALNEYLTIVDKTVIGVSISVAIEKGVSSPWAPNRTIGQDEISKILFDAGLGKWKKPIAERLVTIVHLVAYFVELLIEEDQKILWLSDHDAIHANNDFSTNTAALLGSVLELYTKKKFQTVRVGTSFGKEDTMLMDLLSLPDLVAGCIDHYLSRKQTHLDHTIKQGANEVLTWHCHQGLAMKKYAFIFRSFPDGKCRAGSLDFMRKTPLPESARIPIFTSAKNKDRQV